MFKRHEQGSLQITLIVGCVIAIIIAGMVYTIKSLSDKNDSLNAKIGEMQVTINMLQDTNDQLNKELALKETLKEVAYESSVKHVEETKVIEKKAKVYKKALPKRVVKDTIATDLQNKNSTSRMNVLWDSYCSGSKNDPLCLGEKPVEKLPVVPTQTPIELDVKPSSGSTGSQLNTLLIEKEV